MKRCQASAWLIAAWAGLTFAAPPGPDSLTELSASIWRGGADEATATVSDDSLSFHDGAASLRFETDGAFDTWMWTPPERDGAWDLSESGGVAFWVYADNPNPGFQNGSPWIRLYTAPDAYLEMRSAHDALNEAQGQWVEMRIPFDSTEDWIQEWTGDFDFRSVVALEIHADTWGAGFTLWVDGLRFDLPPQPPVGQVALARNHAVEISWTPLDLPPDRFSHYGIYRSTAPFSDVAGLTPIATVADVSRGAYTDTGTENGVTYYHAVTAVTAWGMETTQAPSIGPRTPRDETDLQVVSIARTPRFPRYQAEYTDHVVYDVFPSGFGPYRFSSATGLGGGQTAQTQRWPALGQEVTYTATVRNRGTNAWIGSLTGSWLVDGVPAASAVREVSMAPDRAETFAFALAWDGQSHEVRFAISAADARPGNNARAIDTRSVAFLSYIDRSRIEEFREETAAYPGAASDDFVDWLNLHADRFNRMFADAGTGKRIHYDVLEVLSDFDADPVVTTIDFAIFPFRFYTRDGSLRLSGYYDPAEDLDYGLLHEMGHQLGLIDLYRLNVAPEQNLVNGAPYSAPECLMNGCSHFLSGSSAGGMEHWLDKAHGYYGQYLYDMPESVKMKFISASGWPVDHAAVTVYQRCEREGLGEIITDQVKHAGLTDDQGVYTLPNIHLESTWVPETFAGDRLRDNPFGYLSVLGTNGVLLFKVERDGYTDYAWLDVTEVNNVYRAGQTLEAVFERSVAIGGPVQYTPPADLTEGNAADWSARAQDATAELSDDPGLFRVGAASLKMVTTGGFDNTEHYPAAFRARWDVSRAQRIRMWCYAENPSPLGFQGGNPVVDLITAGGSITLRPGREMLNDAIGNWIQLDIPIAGDDVWTRVDTGAPDLSAVHSIDIHSDTWDYGFTLWLDGVGFEPPPCTADLDGDGVIDFVDYLAFLNYYDGFDKRVDFNLDGLVDFADYLEFLNHFASGC